jgi:inner membrane protein
MDKDLELSAEQIADPVASTGEWLRKVRRRLGLLPKLIMLGLLMLPAFLALDRIYSLVKERETRYHQVVNEIGELWGKEQLISGPVLVIPYDEPDARNAYIRRHLYILPDVLEIDGTLIPHLRHRGLFEAVVYQSDLSAKGHFDRSVIDASLKQLEENAKGGAIKFFADQAFLSVGLSDTHSLTGSSEVKINDVLTPLAAGSGSTRLHKKGVHVTIGDVLKTAKEFRFNVQLNLKGSRQLKLAPLGLQTRVALKAAWEDPSFVGKHIPLDFKIEDKKFEAWWDISHLGHDFPRIFTSGEIQNGISQKMKDAAFGVQLHQTLTPYRLIVRSIKYGMLFIMLTFAFYFLTEIITRRQVHAIQYLTLTAPLCLFFLLLLSLAEQIGFNKAYAIGTAIVVTMASCYTFFVLASKRRALVAAVALGGLYGTMFLMLNEQSYSLVYGSFGLVALTAMFMWATRDLDWLHTREETEASS